MNDIEALRRAAELMLDEGYVSIVGDLKHEADRLERQEEKYAPIKARAWDVYLSEFSGTDRFDFYAAIDYVIKELGN